MKYLKITLISVAIFGVGIFAYKLNSKEPDELKKVEKTENTFIAHINQQIELIKKGPKLSKKIYNETLYLINDYEKNNKFTKLWSTNLRKKTEYIYYDKFLKDANSVFSNNIWGTNDISYIRNELKYLEKSSYISDKGSLNTLNRILAEYDDANNFLVQIKGYAGSNPIPQIDNKFDSYTVESYIKKAFSISKTQSKIKNNKALMSGLDNVKSLMLSKHINFLKRKLSIIKLEDCRKYYDYNVFFNTVCKPVFNDLVDFKNIANDRYGCETDKWYNTIDKISFDVSTVARESKKSPCFL